MIVLILLVVAVGGLVEIVPLFFQRSTTQPVAGLKPYTALQLAGRDIYIREGCYNCHSQMIRPLRAETLRYGHYSMAGEFVYDHPFQWGSKRTGPDLHRVGGKYSDEWHRLHLNNPRDLVPESNMPAYPWLLTRQGRRRQHRRAHDAACAASACPTATPRSPRPPTRCAARAEIDALVAYLQVLGTAVEVGSATWTSTTCASPSRCCSLVAFIGIVAWAWSRRNRNALRRGGATCRSPTSDRSKRQ